MQVSCRWKLNLWKPSLWKPSPWKPSLWKPSLWKPSCLNQVCGNQVCGQQACANQVCGNQVCGSRVCGNQTLPFSVSSVLYEFHAAIGDQVSSDFEELIGIKFDRMQVEISGRASMRTVISVQTKTCASTHACGFMHTHMPTCTCVQADE